MKLEGEAGCNVVPANVASVSEVCDEAFLPCEINCLFLKREIALSINLTSCLLEATRTFPLESNTSMGDEDAQD